MYSPDGAVDKNMEESGSPGPVRRGLPKFREILRRPRGESDVSIVIRFAIFQSIKGT